jgi:hypothetical protein
MSLYCHPSIEEFKDSPKASDSHANNIIDEAKPLYFFNVKQNENGSLPDSKINTPCFFISELNTRRSDSHN